MGGGRGKGHHDICKDFLANKKFTNSCSCYDKSVSCVYPANRKCRNLDLLSSSSGRKFVLGVLFSCG